MTDFSKLTEARMRAAHARGDLSGLAGEGARLPDRPGDALLEAGTAVGYRLMSEAGVLPEEFRIKNALEAAKRDWRDASTDLSRKAAMARIAELQMRYEIARDARRKFMR